VDLDNAAPFLVGGRVAGKDAERLIKRPAQHLATDGLETVNRPLDEAAGPRFRVAAGAVVLLVGNDADAITAETEAFELASDRDAIVGLAPKSGNSRPS
jgi:hypothetical protein